MAAYAVIDFETTGLSPDHGARPTEIAAVIVRDGKIVDRYQSLMNPGVPIPSFIQSLTGITNQMVKTAPSISQVMHQAAEFVGDLPMVAHNAAFDRKFWEHSLAELGRKTRPTFICSVLLARRLFPEAPSHKLASLVQLLNLPATGRYHRALADAEATAHLLLHFRQELQRRFDLTAMPHELLLAIQKASRHKLDDCIRAWRASAPGR